MCAYPPASYVVDRPTQLICISDICQICQQTNTKDIAGQSATCQPELNVKSESHKKKNQLCYRSCAGFDKFVFMEGGELNSPT